MEETRSERRDLRRALKQAAIVGTYTTPQGNLSDRSTLDLQYEAIMGALDDAGIDRRELDGIAGGRSPSGSAATAYAGMWSELLGQPIRYADTVDAAAAGHSAHIVHAALAVASGLADVVAVIGGSGRAGGSRQASVLQMAASHGEYDASWGSIVPSWFAMVAQRHMHEYGTTPEQLAQIAVGTRAWASLNESAIMRGPLTVDDVLNSRWIAEPLHLFDCCLVNDGAGALIITSRERAAGCRHAPVAILGGAEEYSFRGYVSIEHDWLRSGAAYTGPKSLAAAGLSPEEIDLVEVYDCFTITVLRTLEDLGFCKRGEGGSFIAGHTLGPGGDFPLNTHGGGLSWSHSFSGLAHAIEATRQLQGLSGNRQVSQPETAIVHSQGGPLALHSTAVLAKAR
jgi:acetyl-CoA acetyltransferase